MTYYIDPHVSDDKIAGQAKKQIHRDKEKVTDFDRSLLFSGQSTYKGSKQALARLASRAGKPVPHDSHEVGVKPGTAEE